MERNITFLYILSGLSALLFFIVSTVISLFKTPILVLVMLVIMFVISTIFFFIVASLNFIKDQLISKIDNTPPDYDIVRKGMFAPGIAILNTFIIYSSLGSFSIATSFFLTLFIFIGVVDYRNQQHHYDEYKKTIQ